MAGNNGQSNPEQVGVAVECQFVGLDLGNHPVYSFKLPNTKVVVIRLPYDLQAPGHLEQSKLMGLVRTSIDQALKELPEEFREACRQLLASYSLDMLQNGCSLLDDYAMMFCALEGDLDTTRADERQKRTIQIMSQYAHRYLEATLEQSNAFDKLDKTQG